ncbi:hypothetical protein [Lyngbya aestuarii]|uniref:hypothetical protein n=1 Tax=Lyngbya aestuarii TaxID=118322 RepID=UPI00403DF039
MNNETLVNLKLQIENLSDEQWSLGRETITDDNIINQWLTCFNADTIPLTNVTISESENQNILTLSGTTNLLQINDLQIEIIFFRSHDLTRPDSEEIQCLIKPINFPDTWNLATAYPNLPGYIDFSPDKNSLGRQESFLKDIDFHHVTLLFSSYDFLAADQENQCNGHNNLQTLLKDYPTLNGHLLQVGLNFQATVETDSEIWQQVKQIKPDLDRLSVLGNISQRDDGERLEISHYFLNPETKTYPQLTLDETSGVGITLKRLVLTSGLTEFSSPSPRFAFEIGIGSDNQELELTLALAMGSRIATITGDFGAGKVFSLTEMGDILGLDNLSSYLPQGTAFGQLGLRDLNLNISLSPLKISEIAFNVTTENPWEILDGRVYVQPLLKWKKVYSNNGQPALTTLDIVGLWQLGHTDLILFASPATGDVFAQMDVGQSLDASALFAQLLPGKEKPNFALLDMDLSANYKHKFFSLDIDSGGSWAIDLGGETLYVYNLDMSAEYNPENGLTGIITGIFDVGGWEIGIEVELEEQLRIQTTIPELNVSDILEQFLTAISLPSELPDFVLNNLDVQVIPSLGAFEIQGQSSTPLEIFSGFNFTLSYFRTVRDAAKNVNCDLGLILQLGEVPLYLTANYSRFDNGSESKDKQTEWIFTASATESSIPLGNLIESLREMVGLDYSLPAENLAIRNVNLTFNLGNEDRYFRFYCLVDRGKREYGELTFAADKEILVTETLQANSEWSYLFEMKLSDQNQGINFKNLADDYLPRQFALPDEIESIGLSNLKLSATPKTGAVSLSSESTETWQIPIGVNGLEIKDVALAVNRTVTQDKKKATTGTIGGILKIGSTPFPVTYNFPGDFVLRGKVSSFSLSPLIRYLCGDEILKRTPIPASIIALSFSDIDITIAPQAKTFSLAAAESPLGRLEFLVQKMPDGDWGFTTGFIPPSTWKFSQIADELSVLDGLKFSNTALILSSDKNRNLSLTTLETPRSDISVIRGLNFFANLDLSGLGVDELLGITSLNVYTAISGKPTDIVLEASINGEFQLSDTVAFGDIKFRLQPSPSNFSLTLLGALTVIMNDSQLQFIGGMEVEPRGAVLQATMSGIWNEPFNTKGVSIAHVALDLGVSFAPLLPTIGIAGTLQIGDFEGAMAAKFDSAMPSRSMLAIEFNRLYLMDVIRTFCGATVTNAIPDKLAETVLNIGYENVKIYIVPQDTQIGELYFEQGFRLEGTMLFWGLRAYGYMNIDYLEGTEIRGEVEPINLGGIFKLTGAGNKPKPSLYLKASPQKPPNLDISGAVELLGLRSETQLSFSEKGFDFVTSGRIFDKFECNIEAKGKDFTKGGDFWVKATLRNDLFVCLRKKATEAIEKATESVVGDLSEAQERIERAQREVKKLNNDITNMRREVNRERERDTKRLQDAQREVKKAENEVNKLEKDIRNSHNKIKELKRDIKNKKKSIGRTKNLLKKGSRTAEFAAYSTKKSAEIGVIATKIGGLETAKATAIGALKVAREVLKGIDAGIKIPDIDLDPRIAGLIAARETANVVLEAAELFLEGLIKTMGAIAEVGKFIIDFGLGGILDIRAASFEGSLSATQGGSVALSLTVVFMNKSPETLNLNFNFNDPLSGANALAKKLLPN